MIGSKDISHFTSHKQPHEKHIHTPGLILCIHLNLHSIYKCITCSDSSFKSLHTVDYIIKLLTQHTSHL